MGRRGFLQSSTYPDVTGNWRRAKLKKDDVYWVRRNLNPDDKGVTAFERFDGFHRVTVEPRSAHYLPEDFEKRVCFVGEETAPRILIETTSDIYKLRGLAEDARFRRDPEIAPHVNFRKLSPGNTAVAVGFLKEFGPLTLETMQPREVSWVDLNDFWRKHARFVAIVRLYETRANDAELRQALIFVAENFEQLSSSGPAAIGFIPDSDKKLKYIRAASVRKTSEYRKLGEDGLPWWPYESLLVDAGDLISAELILHTNEGIGSSWIPTVGDHTVTFRPERVILSLWAGIWELFGLDTWTGMTWRACRICGKYFYPLQVNSDCCTPDHQALWSKREYARRSRERAKAEFERPARKKKGA